MVLVSGIAVVDLIASGLERPAPPGGVVFGTIRHSLGGHACNVSTDLVRLGFPRSRLRAVFPAGRDMFGDFLVRELRSAGVRAIAVLVDDAPTALDLVLVVRGEDRRFHADPGANLRMPSAPVLALLRKHKPRMYYAGGVGLLGKFDTDLAAVLREAKRRGALTFVDVVFPYRKSWAFLRKAWRWTDVFHCNADEASSITGKRDPARAAAAIRRLGAKAVFVTMGGDGLIASVPGAVIRLPAFAVRATDPTGAGDAFSAGLILKIYEGLEKNRSLESIPAAEWLGILVYASACGAVCTTGIGTTTAVDRKKVEALVGRHGGALARSSRIQAAQNSSRASRKARTLAGSQS